MLRVFFIGLPALTLVLGVPLALGWVPPNRFYGFRTATSFASLEAWYRINAATGYALVAAGLVAGAVALLLAAGVFALKPEARYLAGILVTAIVMLLFLLPVVIYSNRF